MEAEDPLIRNSCSFRRIQYVKKATISGKIVDVLPLLRKSRKQLHTILIFHCIDVSGGESNSFRKFKIQFFAKAAEKLWSLKPDIDDYITIRNAVPFQDYAYSNTDLFYSKILLVKSLSCRQRILFKKNKEEWRSVVSASSESSEETQNSKVNSKSNTEGVEEIVPSRDGVNPPTRNQANNSDIDINSSTDWLVAKKTVSSSHVPSTRPDHDKSETSSNLNLISPSKENNTQKLISPSKGSSKVRSPESLMQGIVRSHQHQNDENISNRNATSQLKCVYTKLADLRENMVVNIVGIVHAVPATHIRTSTNKCCLFIYVSDDTNPGGFRIRIFYDREEDRPVLQIFYLILCQEMKVTKVRNELCGTIFHCRQIVSFDRDDPKICYKHSSDFNLTPEDEERVERMRDWMFENIPVARPFTPLASIADRNCTVNLRCQIVDVRDYDKNIIVLRVSDGTICEVPFQRVPFECDSWQKALAEVKSNREPSKEIDVIVHMRFDHLYRKFKLECRRGLTVEIFNVTLKLLPEKNKPGNSLKAYLEGDGQNIRVISKKTEPSWINNSNQTSVPKIPETKSKWTINRITQKRKLFEQSPRNENVESDDTDFERSLDVVVLSPKKSKLIAINNPKSAGPSTSSTSLTRAKNSDTYTIPDVLSKHELTSGSTVSSDKEQPLDLSSNTNSVTILKSHSTELLQQVSHLDSQLDSISLMLAHPAKEKAAAKSVHGLLHQSVKSLVALERKEIQKRLAEYNTKNNVSNYLVQWPSDPGDDAFYIQVTIMSTIPFINVTSSDFELLGLISGYCDKCDHFFPFYLAKWIVSEEDGPVSICPKCKEHDVMSPLKHELLCEFLLNDDFGNSMPGIVLSHHAENLLGCTVSQLCSSVEAKIRVRTFFDSHVFSRGKEKRPLIVKVIRIFSQQHGVYKYHILS